VEADRAGGGEASGPDPHRGHAGVVEDDGHYLVIELPGKRIGFPGGFLKQNETPQQGAELEGYEQTGLYIQTGGLINYYTLRNSDWRAMSNISFAFHGHVVGGKLHNNIEGHPCWLEERELHTRLSGHSRTILADYLNYRDQHRLHNEYHPTLISLPS